MPGAPPRTVLELIKQSAEREPSATAVLGTGAGESLTHAELLTAVSDLAVELSARGIGPSDVVLVSLPNGPSMLVAVLGTMCAAACAPVNPGYTRSEMQGLAYQLQPAAVVTEPDSAGVAAVLAIERGLPVVEVDHLRVLGGTGVPGDVPEPAETATALVLHTAGTTAQPKQVPLTHANLAAAAGNVVESLQLSPADRCLNVMPLFHSHGLLGAAMSTLHAGGSILCTPGMDPRKFLQWATTFDCTWYTAASTVHQMVLRTPGEWKGLRFMRSASGPLAPQVATELEERFGAPMIEVYGMTEAYQIAANPLPPGERRLGTVGRPTGTEVGVLGRDGVIRTAGGEGEIVVRGPAVFGGYSSPASANTDAFVDGRFRTGDLGRISEDGYLTITGRVKEQINRGGEKVSPREVEESLLDHPDIVEAMAFAIPHAELGEEIGAALVLRAGASIELKAVREYLHGRISPFKVPRHVVVVDEIPVSSTGKPQRLTFARQFAEGFVGAEVRAARAVGDGASTEERLASMWKEVIGLDELPVSTDGFFQLGGTSLAAMELVVRIEEDLGVDLPMLDLLEVPALGTLATRVDELRAADRSAPLLRLYREGDGARRLVLIPGQFGMALGLNLIADAVDSDVDIYLFDYPGHRPGQVPLETIDELARCLLEELEAAGLTRDVALYGNSMGGWVAFEAGRRLAEEGRPTLFVAIGDMYSPYFASKSSPLRPSLSRRVWNRVRRAGHRARGRWQTRQTDARSPAIVRQEAVVAASARASRQYDARPYTGELLVVAASEREPKFGATLGWERHSSGSINSLRVAGLHSTMHRTEAVPIGRALGDLFRSGSLSQVDSTETTESDERAPVRTPTLAGSNPTVASLLVTHRRPGDVATTLERIAAQSLPVSVVLVVNVEADRDTAQVVEERAAVWSAIEYLAVTQNVGPAGAVALGAPEVLKRCPEADYVVFFEDDDPPPSADAVARLIGHLESRPEVERVGGAGFHGAVLDRRSAILRRPRVEATGWANVDYLAGGSCPVFTRSLLEEIGGYDETLFFGFEELEFGLRARAAGWRFHLLAHDSFGVRATDRSPSQLQLGDWSWRRYYGLRNLLVILLRHGHHSTALRVALGRSVLKPLCWLPFTPRRAVRHLRYNVLAIRDAVRGRLGRTIEPSP